MFPYIGIMADEEPKDSISPSGLYNSSESTATKNDFSTPLIDGLSEFTFMMWVYVPTAITYVAPYIEKGAYIGNSMPFIIKNGSIGSSITNSNGGRTVVDYFTAVPKDEFIHVTVTGSVSNNRIRMYLNGSLGQSAVMTYANDVSTSSFLSLNQTGFSISHVNAFNRELSEAEVAEHYVYDDDLLFAGVLGYDAMTASQRNGLVYSSSYTNTISIAGNEFTDKSGNGITLSPQPSLTGQQIYVYTDANDLPNGGDVPVIYPVNSANLNGTSQSYLTTGLTTTSSDGYTFSAYVKFKSWGTVNAISQSSFSSNGADWFVTIYAFSDDIYFEVSSNGSTFTDQLIYSTALSLNTWYKISCVILNNTHMKIFVDDVEVATKATTESIRFGTHEIETCRRTYTTDWYNDSYISLPYHINRALILSEIEELSDDLGNPRCFDLIPTAISDDIYYAPRLSNWGTNIGGELIDESSSGATTISTGSPTYTDTSLSVECGGTPTPPSNALPSNLPTIL